MRRALRILGAVLLVFVLGMAACVPLLSKALPEGADPDRGDALARALQNAVDVAAWDTTAFVRWNFLGQHEHLWDRRANRARVRWGAYTVYLDAGTRRGAAWKGGDALSGEALEQALSTAVEHFYNDAFWLNAPAKAFDAGTTRLAIPGEEHALLVRYASGGVTPGDTYGWYLAPDGTPEAWRMWVQVLPIPGLRVTWEGWDTLYSGARIATVHGAGPLKTTMIRDLAAAPTLAGLGEPAEALAPWRFTPPE
jgi:hypothetical protein